MSDYIKRVGPSISGMVSPPQFNSNSDMLVQADVDRAFSEMYGNSEQAAEKNSSSESKSKADLNKMNAPDSLPS
ncbi:hypothetical protein Q7M00_04840 [Candidatus Liberibacter asiaticus]